MSRLAQAVRCDTYEVKLHIYRQRTHGARLIGETDFPRPIEFVVTGVGCAAMALTFAAKHYHWFGWGL